jgi:Phospholipid methyltransferase
LRLDRGNFRTLLTLVACLVGQPTPAAMLGGSALLLAGSALHLWAKGCLRINQEITTSGPYRFTRNPFYLANLLIDVGICVTARRLWLLGVAVALWAFVYRRTIVREEQQLETLFGERYRAYRARVPRWFPLRGSVSGLPVSEPFSWRNPNLAAGQEYARLAGIFAIPLLVWLVAGVRGEGVAFVSRSPSLALTAMVALSALYGMRRVLIARLKRERGLVPDRE